MARDPRFRGGRWFLVGALALAATWAGAAVAEGTLGATAAPGASLDGTPAGRPVLTPAERAHIRQIRRFGRERGLTDAQIHAEIEAYLKSIRRTQRVKTTSGDDVDTP